jgi:flagellar basal-body rod modification protein FlgD
LIFAFDRFQNRIHPMDALTSATTTTPISTNATRRPAETSDYNTFLRMLTTQMQNQDPLNPIDSADYAVQLATFSGVEQQTRTNQLMEKLLGSFDMRGLSEVAGWVGKEARSAAPVAYDGAPVVVPTDPDSTADRAVLAVRNAAGTVVAREDVVLSASSHTWNGRDLTGAALPDGPYSFSLESYVGEALLSDRAIQSYARIDEVRSSPTGTRIVLQGGIEIASTDVTALRGPSA